MKDNQSQCYCNNLPKLPDYPVVAMAYVPFQTELVTYTSDEALCSGTLFPELDKNFYGGMCCG
ncbi:MAG: spore coat associated protein CotJA [Clostridia bacterium]|nr:spore coat associated protein CotJA [Clostridia bacterium]